MPLARKVIPSIIIQIPTMIAVYNGCESEKKAQIMHIIPKIKVNIAVALDIPSIAIKIPSKPTNISINPII